MKAIFKILFLSLCIIANTHLAFAQTASILPPGYTQYLDNNGKPLTSGKVYNYIPSTTTNKTTWQDGNQSVANSNPVVLDAGGRAKIFGDGSYRQRVFDRNNNLIWDANTSSTGSGGSTPVTATGDGDLVGTIKPWAGLTAPNQYMFTYGQEVSRVTYAALYTAVTSTQAVFCNSGSPILNGLSDTTSFWIGMSVEITCVAPGFTTIVDKTSTSVTLAINANVTTNTSAIFYPWGRGNGSTTFTLPDFRGLNLSGNNNMGGSSGPYSTVAWFGATNPNSIGAKGGGESYRLTTGNQPDITSVNAAQSITVSTGNHIPTANSNWAGTTVTSAGAVNIAFTGGSIGSTQSLGPTANSISTTYTNPGGGAGVATVAAGGSGYTTGTQLLTLTGGTCAVAPQYNVTVVAGAITAPVLFREGICTTRPSNPVSTSGGGGTLGTLNVNWSPASFSTVAPTKTVNYIIKVTPDTNAATASGVTSLGLMTGDIACGTGLLCTGNNISATSLPLTIGTTAIASGTTKGLLYNNAGFLGNLATANNGVLVTDGSGNPSISSTLPAGLTATTSFTSPQFNMSGSTSGSVALKAPAIAGSNTITFPAGTTDFTSTGGTSQFVRQNTLGGALTVVRPACADLSNGAVYCSAAQGQLPGDTTNAVATAGNIGEIFSSTIVAGSAVVLSTGTPANVATITLTAGTWDISAQPAFTGGATTQATGIRASISTSSATENTAAPNFWSSSYTAGFTPFATFNLASSISPIRVALSGSQQYWLVARCEFTVAACNAFGSLRATRIK